MNERSPPERLRDRGPRALGIKTGGESSRRLLALLPDEQIDDGSPQQGGVTQPGWEGGAPALPQATGNRWPRVFGLPGEPAGRALQKPRPAQLALMPDITPSSWLFSTTTRRA